jgi:hypothetical protein
LDTQDAHELLNYLPNECLKLLEKEQKELQPWLTVEVSQITNCTLCWLGILIMTQDAHEFLNYLLNECSELLEKESSWSCSRDSILRPYKSPLVYIVD